MMPTTFVVIICVGASFVLAQKKEVASPPTITNQSEKEVAYIAKEKVKLKCLAIGQPGPSYRWQKNGEWLLITGIQVRQMPTEGTLVIADPQAAHEGIYQCFASNSHGTASTVKTVLKKAVLEPFPTVKEPQIHRRVVGSSLVLSCHPPHSYPTGSIYWGENSNSSKLRPIENTERVSQDFSGNLYFANIQLEDSLSGHAYMCLVDNKELRSLVQGDDQKIEPIPTSGILRHEAPRFMWSSPGLDIAVKGLMKKMKCIFSGYPTPQVSWSRLDGELPSNAESGSFGQELIIPNVDFSDAGRYQCQATNQVGSEPQKKDFTLTVESPPFWRNKPPEDVNTSEEENAMFECLVNGHPKPTITWYINGVLEEDAPPNPRRAVGAGWLKYDSVTKTDAQVIQCNASNAHGYIFANAYLNVLAESPTFIDAPQRELKVAEGQSALFKCKVFGAPKPVLIWQKGLDQDDVRDIDRDHYNVLDNGNLEIASVRKEDQDTYQCYVFNKLGSDVAPGKLFVVDRTVIVDPPKSQVVMTEAEVSFWCNATTDPNEIAHLKIEWMKNDVLLTAEESHQWSILDGGRRLSIKHVAVGDSGSYTCTAANGIDSDSVTVALTVKDKPSPPYNLHIVSCTREYSDIEWASGSDNNDPVTGFTVYFNTSHDEAGKFHEAIRIKGTSLRNTARIPLRPWTNYTFHVTSENGIGTSNRSEFTRSNCATPAARPYRNPHRVCTESRDPGSLVIIWEPMLRTEHNGEGFHYLISYKRHDHPDAEEITYQEYDWRQSELKVPNQETYKEYEISVQAVNNIGSAQGDVEKKLGHSSEDVPLVTAENFHLVSDSLNSTNATFRWEPVDATPDNIRGFFRGYQIRFWKAGDDSNVRTEDVILHEWLPCVPLHRGRPRHRRSSSSQLVEASTSKLWPFSLITAGVVVLNGAKSGRISQLVNFETPEGVPSAVPAFWVSERGSHHLRLSWTAPFEINGILLGYQLSYKKAPPAMDSWHYTYITDPLQTYQKFHGLSSDTMYLLSIWAQTRAGRGLDNTIQETTVSVMVPDKPSIDTWESGHDFVNISWLPSGKQTPRNPGSEFVVRYRQQYGDDWKETPSEKYHNWMNVTDLEFGQTYDFCVVALNHAGDRMNSEHQAITVGMTPEPQLHNVATAPWFLALICFLVLILLILIIIFLIRRNRGGKYPVYEKEKLHGNKGKLDEEPTFGEYVRTEDSMIKKSQGSLESSSKSEEDGSDSLGAYEDVDPTKFNDEGSFVDQAGYRRPLVAGEVKPCSELTSPSALTTQNLRSTTYAV